MSITKNIKWLSKQKREEKIVKLKNENELLQLKLTALEETMVELKKVLTTTPITDKSTYKEFSRLVRKYTNIKTDFNKTKAKYISNLYLINWLGLDSTTTNKKDQYVYAKHLYQFIKFVESNSGEKIFPYSFYKLYKFNKYHRLHSIKTIKLSYLKNVKLRAYNINHKSTWFLRQQIKNVELQIKDSLTKINEIQASFADRYHASLITKLDKCKKDANAEANAKKLASERLEAKHEAEKVNIESIEKKQICKASLKNQLRLLFKQLSRREISKRDYRINKSKLIDKYHEDIANINAKIRESYYYYKNYSTFETCQNVVDLKNVVKYYNNGFIATKVLDKVNLKIKKGEFVVILGPSGSGKTTLLNIISGMDNATYGDVFIADENLIDYNQTQLTTFRRKNIGYVFQQYGLLPNLTVKENIQMGQNLQSNKSKIIDIELILESIGLTAQVNKYPNELSGGQQQRVSIARSIAKNPNILFGDEPTGAIDGEMSKEIMRLFIEINKKYHTTIIIVTHNPIIAELATMVINVANGTIARIDRNSHPKTVDELNWSAIATKKSK